MNKLYRSAKNGRIYTESQLKDAHDAFWKELTTPGWGGRVSLTVKPENSWERFISALKLEEAPCISL